MSEERSIGETLVREFILGDVADTSASLASSQHLLRLLNEVQDDLSRHSASAYSSALQGHAGPERLSAVLAVAAAVSEARVLVADACYSELDVSVNALDRRLKLMEAVLKLHGQTLGEESANGVEEKMSEITRAPDAVSSRMRRRDPPAGSAAAGDAGAAAAAAGAGGGATGATGALQQQLAAATGGGGGSGQSSSPSALDVAIGTFEPLYCACAAPTSPLHLSLWPLSLSLSLSLNTLPFYPPPCRRVPASGLW